MHTMKLQIQPIIKGRIAQHNLTDGEYKKIIEILGRKLICIWMDS
jgi:hypothetical protein